MNLLAVTNLYPRPDRPQAGRFNAQLFAALARVGAPPQVLALVPEWRPWRWSAIRAWRTPEPGALEVAYRPVGYLPVLGRHWSPVTYAATLGDLETPARAADAVLVPWLYPDGVAVIRRLTAVAHPPVWLMALGSDTLHLNHPIRRRQMVAACARAAGVFCVSRPLALRLESAGVAPERLHVTPNGVDGERFHFRSRVQALHQLGAAAAGLAGGIEAQDSGAPLILFAGNLVEVKGPDLAIAALAAAPRAAHGGAPPHLLVIGAGPMQAALARQARRLGVASRIIWAGSRPHAEVALWMNVADVLCLSSRHEGMPNVILEALASGLPVVAADVGDCAGMAGGEAAARVVPAGHPAALARAWEALLAAPIDRPALAARHGRRSWEDQAREILDGMRRLG